VIAIARADRDNVSWRCPARRQEPDDPTPLRAGMLILANASPACGMYIPRRMADPGRAIDTETLLAHASWLRGLALRLVRDADEADDLVQDTWVATVQHAPDTARPVRPWLAKVLVNALRMRARRDGRRTAREQATLVLGDDVPSPERLVERAQAQRTLVDLVLRLEEPYRSTVLLHFCEGVSLADIARAQAVPASTVRRRLKTALDQLRRGLDDEAGGRKQWAGLLIAAHEGAVVANKTSKLIALALILLAILVTAIVLVTKHDAAGTAGTTAGRTTAPTAGTGATAGGRGSTEDLALAWIAQRDVAPRRIAGRVVAAGTPVAGASVELASLVTESGAAAPPRLTTGADGTFDFGPQPAMEWSVRATAPGRTGVAVEVDLRNPVGRPRPDQLELELAGCDLALFGTVRDASGGPIARARLARLSTDPGAIPGGARVETDDAGAYELCVTARWPGWVGVEVSAAGYGTIWFNALVLGRIPVDFALVPEATIVGRVIRDDTGEPVPRAHVFIPPGPPGRETTAWRGAFADAHGRFRIDRVAPGRHLVMARAEHISAPARGTPVVIDAGQTSAEIEIRLEPGATLRGVVRTAGTPVAGAHVIATTIDGGSRTRDVVSQADGSFVLDEVPRAEVRFSAAPYDVLSPATFRVTEAAHHGIVLDVEALGAITGTVVRGGRAVPGADLVVNGPNELDLGPVRTDGAGRFELRGLRAGPWTLYASSGSLGAFGRAPDVIQLTRGATVDVTIELTYAAAIAGTVIDQDGAPVAGVSVEFQHTTQDDAGAAVTASDGTFRAALMTGGGTYRASVRKSQLSPEVLRPAPGTQFPAVALADGDDEVTGVTLAVQLDRLTIAGTVTDTSGAPVADARVTAEMVHGLRPPQFRRWIQHGTAVTDVDGRFTIVDLSAGDYAVRARAPSGGEVTVAGIRAGRTDVALVLPAPGAIEGTLVGFATTPQVSASGTDPSSAGAPAYATPAGTSFALRGLSPGSYLVLARTTAEIATAVVEVVAGQTARVTLTSGGSGTVAGRVREFRSGAPVEGMTCRALPSAGRMPGAFPGTGARTDAQGRFTIAPAPAGDIVVTCSGLWRLYSDGARGLALAPSERTDVDVPVVAWRNEVALTMGSIGAELDPRYVGARLIGVQPGGPAATAGFQDGDVITAVDGTPVTALSAGGVRILIENRPPGTGVPVAASRAGRTIAGTIVLGETDLR
jgi:RNA polymerase sigma factor (sigma-70 family)